MQMSSYQYKHSNNYAYEDREQDLAISDVHFPFRGPLFGQLKGGKTVTLENGKVITPEDVLEPADVRRNFVSK